MRRLQVIGRVRAAQQRLPRNVRTLGWISFANDAASELAYPIVPLFLTITLGAPVAAVGVIEGIAEGLATGVKFVSGWISDRMGNRRTPWVAGGYAASVVARALVAAAPAWGWVLGGRVVDRFGKGARTAPRDALIRDSTPAEHRGSAFGYHRAMDTLGAILGPLVAVVLLESGVSLRGILWVALGVGAATLVLLRGLREAPPTEGGASTVSAREPLPAPFWAALAVWVVFSLGNSSDAFLILRARDLGLGAVVVVLAYAVYNVVYASLSWPLGSLSDTVPRSLILSGGLGVFALVYLGLAITSHGWAVWPLFAVYGVYIAATEGVARAWIANTIPDRAAVGTAYGVFYLATAVATLAASVVAGVLWSYVSPRAPFVVGAAAAVAALVLLLAFELGWQAQAAAIKRALAAVSAALLVAAAVAAVLEHRRIVDAFGKGDAAGLPAAFVRPCNPASSERVSVSFPSAGSTYTTSRTAGASTILTGFRAGDVTAANAAYRDALRRRGFDIVRSEIDPADAKVVFANATTTGQVAMTQECRDRVHLRITFRSA
jgi:MFS family permease